MYDSTRRTRTAGCLMESDVLQPFGIYRPNYCCTLLQKASRGSKWIRSYGWYWDVMACPKGGQTHLSYERASSSVHLCCFYITCDQGWRWRRRGDESPLLRPYKWFPLRIICSSIVDLILQLIAPDDYFRGLFILLAVPGTAWDMRQAVQQ